MDKAMRPLTLLLLLGITFPLVSSAQPWEDVFGGPVGRIYSMAADDDHLIVSDFVSERPWPYEVHRYDGHVWENISDSIIAFGNPIKALCLYRGVPYCYHYSSVYGAGVFAYDESNWNLIGQIPNGQVWGMRVHEDTLYIHGEFRSINGDTTLRYIAKYDGEQFHPVAAPLYFSTSLGPIVKDIHFYQGDLYAVGDIRTATGRYHISRWDGIQWNDVGDGFPYGSYPSEFAEYDGYLLVDAAPVSYAGTAQGISAWEEEQFHGLGLSTCAYVSGVDDMALHNGLLYASRLCIDTINGVYVYFASWDGERWCTYDFSENAWHMTSFQGRMYAYLLRYEQPNNQPVHRFVRWLEETEADSCGDFINVGIEESDSEHAELQVYPNPSTGPFTLSWQSTATEPYSLMLYDAQGRAVQTHSGQATAGHNAVQLELSHLPSGIYFGRLTAGDGVRSFKWVRE
jgi:hypothetical protein